MSRINRSREDVAAYVATLTGELSLISRKNGLSTLAYLLDVARLEADNLSRLEHGEAPDEALSAPGS